MNFSTVSSKPEDLHDQKLLETWFQMHSKDDTKKKMPHREGFT